MAGTISPSFPVFVVENRRFGLKVYCRPADLAQQFGDYNNIEDIKWWRDGVAPSLSRAIRTLGGLQLIPLIAQAQEMGDESHNRNSALTAMFGQYMALGMGRAGVNHETSLKIQEWFAPHNWSTGSGVRAALGLVMAAAKASLDPIIGLENSTVVSCMCRNGVDFGLRVAGMGNQWYTAPAPIAEGKFFGRYRQSDAGGDMGDSAITETNGWGSFILSSAMGFLKGLPATADRAFAITSENHQIVLAANDAYPQPIQDFRGAPCGIDVRKVINTGSAPWINTGITHKEAGHRVIGRGLVRAPMLAFEKATKDFADKHGVDKDELLHSAMGTD